MNEIAEAIGMAQSTFWRKLNDLEATGAIRARVALLDPARLGLPLCILASIRLASHSEEAIAGFLQTVRARAEIIECHAVSGEADYVLKIRAADIESYERFMSRYLLRNPFISGVQSSFVLKEIKSTTELPLDSRLGAV